MLLPLQKQKARNNKNAKPAFLNIVLNIVHAQCLLFLLKDNNSTIFEKTIHIF